MRMYFNYFYNRKKVSGLMNIKQVGYITYFSKIKKGSNC